MDRLREIIHEAHRRSLWQVVGLYLAGSWVAFEVVSTMTSSLDLPSWVPGFALVLLVVGLPIVVATAFVQEGPPGDAEPDDGDVPRGVGVAEADGSEAGQASERRADARLDEEEAASGGLSGALFTWRNALVGGFMAFCVLFGIAGLWVLFQEDGGTIAPPEVRAGEAAPAIAVLPFSVRGEGLEMLREGMVDVLSHALDGAAGFRAVSNRTVLARWRERTEAREEVDLETHLAVSRATGARYAIVGSAVSLGQETRLVGDVYESESGDRIASASVEGPASDLSRLADRLAVELLKSLLEGGGSVEGVDVGRVLTESPEALREFLEGERHLRRFEQKQAAAAFRQALEADSAFALAHWRLVEVHTWGQTVNLSLRERHLQAAYRHRERLTDRDALMVEALNSSTREEARLLRAAVSRYPDEAMAWYLLGEVRVHGPQLAPTAAEVEEAFERALELDPRRPGFYPHALELAINHRRDSGRSAQLAERYAELSRPTGPYTFDIDPRAAPLAVRLAFGRDRTRERLEAVADSLPPGLAGAVGAYFRSPANWELAAPLFEAYVRRGEPGDQRLVARRELALGRLIFEARVDDALALMRQEPAETRVPPNGEGFTWPRILFQARVAGLPVPDSVLDRLMAVSPDDPEAGSEDLLWAGFWAYERGDRAAAERIRSVLAERADRLEGGEGDEEAGGPPAAPGLLRLLDARAALAEGRAREALALFEEGTGSPWVLHWWRARAAMEAEEYEKAAEVLDTYAWPDTYLPFRRDPPVRGRLARVLEALGRPGEAAEAYAYFAEHWADAPPPARERVRTARERASSLRGSSPVSREGASRK